MSTTVEALESEVLSLPTRQRARLIERLIASMDAETDIEYAWAAEVERRQAEIDSGSVALLSGIDTLTQLRAKFQ